MGFGQVADQYARQIEKQFNRQERQHRDFTTKDEQAAVKFYTAAQQAVEALEVIPEGEPEGFVMRTAAELAPIKLGFNVTKETNG